MKNKKNTVHHKKRQGQHHRRTRDYHRVYLPYLPLVVAIIISIVISGWRPTGNTLAYATNTSVSGLLAATNNQRVANGQSTLSINSQLNNAAQSKANDMTSRNYWSHNTPEGQEPWIFVDAAGYKYLKAGENLAYGFTDSDSTITGWMNSPTHKANMLDAAFSEVGFGYANSASYNNSGQQTVVVAMYGKPQTLAASSQPSAPTPAASPAPQQQAPTPPASVPTPAEIAPVETPSEPISSNEADLQPVAFTSDTPGLEPMGVPVTRVAALTGTNAPWAAFGIGIILGSAVIAFLMKHAVGFRKILTQGEQFVLHHPLFDSTVAGIVILGITLLQTTGFIK